MADDKKQRNLNLPESLTANRLRFTTCSFGVWSHRTSAAAPPISNRKSSTVVFERRRSDSSSRIPRHLGLEPSRLEIVTNIFPIVKYNSINVWKIGKTQVDWVREHQIRWSGHELRWKDYQRWRRLGETARSSSDGTRRKS